MELNLVSKSKNSMEIEIIGEDETLLEPLKNKLLEDSAVEIATIIRGHPMLEFPKIYLQVKSGKPQSAFKKAAKALSGEFTDLNKQIERTKISKTKTTRKESPKKDEKKKSRKK
jgi:DNA-directed RNA polymerase subunit L